MTVTPDDLKTVKWETVMCLDGEGFYINAYRCKEYPDLTAEMSGPAKTYSSKGVKPDPNYKTHTKTIYVNGHEVPCDLQAIADALNAMMEKHHVPS